MFRAVNSGDGAVSLLSEQHDPYTATSGSPNMPSRLRLLQPSGGSMSEDGLHSDSASNGANGGNLRLRTEVSFSSLSLSGSFPGSPMSSRPPASVVLSRANSRTRILWLHLLLLVLAAAYAYNEQGRLSGSTDQLLPAASILALNNLTHPLFPNHSIASNATHRTRVVFFVLDGMRSDAVTTSPALSAFLASLQPHVAVRSSLAQLPAISFPNWLTLATGVRPSTHGFYGNDVIEEVGWSSIFSEQLRANSPNGVAGHSWWSTMFNSQLTPWTGDGTITDFVNYGEARYKRGGSEFAVDREYNRNLHRAINSRSWRHNTSVLFDYEMFLVYFCDVDGASHGFGPHSEEAQTAIETKTGFIRDAIAAIDEVDRSNSRNGVHFRTTYVITADHGHIDVGGHGGLAEQVRSIPLIFYQNHSYLSYLTPAAAAANGTTPTITSPLPPPPASYSPANVDIAITVSALAGVRVPRQSEGMFVSDVLGVLLGGANERAYRHYADLFVQKRALARELLSVLGQSSSSELSEEEDATLLPQPSSGANYSALIGVLNERTGALVQLIDRSKASYLSYQLAVSWVLSTLFLLLVLLPLLAWVYNSSTFLSSSAALPGRVASWLSTLSYYVRYVFVRGYRAVGGHTRPLVRYSTSYSPTTLRLNRSTCALGLGVVLSWLLLMLFQFNVLFRYGYRPASQWRWDYTLYNSRYDAYVLIFGFGLLASLLVALILHAALWLLLRSQLASRLLSSLELDESVSQSVLSPNGLSNGAAAHASSASEPKAVVLYYVVMYCSLWSSLLLVLFGYAQSYHCFYLPWLAPLSSLLTPAIWTARFQSVTLSFMLLPAYLYLGCVVWWQQWRVWAGLVAVQVVERKGDQLQWLEDKQRNVLLLAALTKTENSSLAVS